MEPKATDLHHYLFFFLNIVFYMLPMFECFFLQMTEKQQICDLEINE